MPKALKRRILFVTALVLLSAGAYLLVLVFAPQIRFIASPYNQLDTASSVDESLPEENYLQIPKLDLQVAFKSGDKSVLEDGAWWRFPERGDPEKGGNFILSAHRFKLGWTPQRTKKQSQFYHLDKLNVGDEITVHFNGQDHHYKVTREYSVKPDAAEIEAPSDAPKLTIYTCTLKGSADGRTVIEAASVTLSDGTAP